MKKTLILLSAFFFCSCAMPSTAVRTTDTRPSLAFEGAPEGATVFLDGLLAGEAEKYDGQPGVLLVEPGTHHVVVKGRDGTVLMERKVYVESEIKTIKVH
jgi:hypothetical protein